MQHSIQTKISTVLAEHQPRILFGYLFGSADTPLEHPRSDLDIAVYFQALSLEHKLDLYTALSRATKRNRIYIVVLNHLQEPDPFIRDPDPGQDYPRCLSRDSGNL